MKVCTCCSAVSLALCAILATFAASARETTQNALDNGTEADLKNGVNYKEATPSELKKRAQERREKQIKKDAAAISAHIKTLNKSNDEADRASAAEYLGVLNAYVAIPDLIDCLRPGRKEKESVMRSANGALIKITQKNFGMQGYDKWHTWWIANKVEFLKKVKDEVPETDKIMAESANTQGLELMKIADFRAAYNQFLVAVDKNPKVPDYHNNAGIAVMELGRPLDAMEYFQETIGFDPALPQPYMNIGRCYSRMERSIEARSWFEKAKDRDKSGEMWDIFWMIGKEYLKLGQYKLSYEYLDQARSKAEKRRIRDPRLYNDLAICHYGLDQYHSAWKEICNMRFLGFDANEDFVKKVRKVLIEAGTDPDEEDALARKNLQELLKGEEEQPNTPGGVPTKVKEPSILDSLKLK